jgi:hypothetical protein
MNMKPFNLEAALAGAPVVTRDGQAVAGIHHFTTVEDDYVLGAVVNGSLETFSAEGAFNITRHHGLDLFMAPVMKSGWVNVYWDNKNAETFTSDAYATSEEAATAIASSKTGLVYLSRFAVEWEE